MMQLFATNVLMRQHVISFQQPPESCTSDSLQAVSSSRRPRVSWHHLPPFHEKSRHAHRNLQTSAPLGLMPDILHHLEGPSNNILPIEPHSPFHLPCSCPSGSPFSLQTYNPCVIWSQYRPQNTIVLIIGPLKGYPNLGNSHFGSPAHEAMPVMSPKTTSVWTTAPWLMV